MNLLRFRKMNFNVKKVATLTTLWDFPGFSKRFSKVSTFTLNVCAMRNNHRPLMDLPQPFKGALSKYRGALYMVGKMSVAPNEKKMPHLWAEAGNPKLATHVRPPYQWALGSTHKNPVWNTGVRLVNTNRSPLFYYFLEPGIRNNHMVQI